MKPDEFDVGVLPTVELSNEERRMLRAMNEPGAPLWKILKSALDYGEELRNSLVGVDLDDDKERKAGRKIQAAIVATIWITEHFNAALTLVDEPETKEE